MRFLRELLGSSLKKSIFLAGIDMLLNWDYQGDDSVSAGGMREANLPVLRVTCHLVYLSLASRPDTAWARHGDPQYLIASRIPPGSIVGC